MSEYAVKVDNVTKKFILPHQRVSTLKSYVTNPFSKKEKETQLAVNDVSFEIKKGEFFGIVGRNGSGKSTLLKCMAGVYTPDAGNIMVDGTIVPFIELGVGFNPQLSGRDNVFLNGALLGFKRQEMEQMYDEIVEFSELERFMDQKLKNYSSGMQVRLAFSIAIRAQGDILLLDEVLAVGDSAFQQKCFDYFATLKESNRTIILVSHNMPAIERFCDRALLLEYGQVKDIGKSSDIAGKYEDMFLKEEANKKSKKSKIGKTEEPQFNDVELVKTETVQEAKPTSSIGAYKDFEIDITLRSKIEISAANIGVNIKNSENHMLLAFSTKHIIGGISLKKGEEKKVSIKLENIYSNGRYHIDLAVADCGSSAEKILFKQKEVHKFNIHGVRHHEHSLTHPKMRIAIDDKKVEKST